MRRRNGLSIEPVAIDPASGFKVPLSDLVRQWDNELIDKRFVDKRNPQDFVRGVADKQNLPYARPEPPDSFVATNIAWEDGRFMTTETGVAIITEGLDPGDTL
jgi:hypothetical protein